MVGSPLGRKCKTKGSICSEVKENQLEGCLSTPVSSVGKDAQILKKNSSHALSTRALCGKETKSTRELRSSETRNTRSFSSPTISSSRKSDTEKQKVQVQQIKPRLKKDLESEAIKTSQVKDTTVPRQPPLPKHTKSSEKAPTSELLQKRTRNQNSVSQSGPSKQYVRRCGTQKTLIPPQDLAGKTRIPTSIGQSKSSTSTKKSSRIRETYLGHEEPEPVHHIVWEGPEETFHSSGNTCPLCENDLSDMPDEYYDDIEPSVFPSVAILPCGHSFHAECLERINPEENSSDPSCFFCLSCMS